MIVMGGRCYLDVRFEGFEELLDRNFVSFKMLERDGLSLPVCELVIFQDDFSLYRSVVRGGLRVEVTLGSEEGEYSVYEFGLLNYSYIAVESGYNLLLSCILDVGRFTNESDVYGVRGSSDVVLRGVGGLSVDIDYVGDDSQVWLRSGNSEKSFVEGVVSHSYIGGGDFVLCGISGDGVLRGVSYLGQLGVGGVNKIGVSGDDVYIYGGIKFESGDGFIGNFVGDGRGYDVLSVDGRGVVSGDGGRLSSDGEDYSDRVGNVRFYQSVDMGNVHRNYYRGYVDNLSSMSRLRRNNIYVTFVDRFLSLSDFRVLDGVDLLLGDKKNFSFGDGAGGRYVVMERYFSIVDGEVVHRLRLNRDFLSK